MITVVLKFEFEEKEDEDAYFDDLDNREDLNYASYEVVSRVDDEDEE